MRETLTGAVVMAPMTKGSNLPYRRLCSELGATVTVGEMALAKQILRGSKSEYALIRFRVLVDGKAPGAAHGTDTDEQGSGTVDAQRLYQLVRQESPVADRTFEIEFLDPGAEAYAFTFG